MTIAEIKNEVATVVLSLRKKLDNSELTYGNRPMEARASARQAMKFVEQIASDDVGLHKEEALRVLNEVIDAANRYYMIEHGFDQASGLNNLMSQPEIINPMLNIGNVLDEPKA